jgi:hypothetical protein
MGYMMSENNPFGLRPDELPSALASGHLHVTPYQSEVKQSVEYYNKTSAWNDKISPGDAKYYIDLAIPDPSPVQRIVNNIINPGTSSVLDNLLPQPVLVQAGSQGLVSPQNNPILEGVSGAKLETYITIGIMFLVVNSIVGLFRR